MDEEFYSALRNACRAVAESESKMDLLSDVKFSPEFYKAVRHMTAQIARRTRLQQLRRMTAPIIKFLLKCKYFINKWHFPTPVLLYIWNLRRRLYRRPLQDGRYFYEKNE